MSITFQQEWYYAGGVNTTIPNDTNVSYYHAACCSYGTYYMMVLKYYTSESIQAPSITLRCISDGTTSAKYLGAYFVPCGQNDTPDSNLTKNALTLDGKCQARIRFAYNCTGMTGSWVSGSSNKSTATCTTDVKIPKGYFFIYIGCANSSTPGWTTIAAHKTTVSSYTPVCSGTNLSKYTISYNANGGSGAPSSTSKDWGVNVSLSSTRCSKTNTTATGYKVTFNGNGGTAGSASLSATNTISYTHSSWNTASGGGGTSYSLGGTYSANANATLYAIYTSSTSKGSITLPSASRANYNFLGWSTSSTATTASYAAGSSYTPSSSHTLYAVWQRQTVSVTYETDGGTLSNPTRTVNKGSNITLPTATECVKNGGTLLGWTTNVYGTTPDYDPGATYYITTDTIFYAIWKMGDLIYIKVNGQWKLGRVGIKLGDAWVGLD